MNVQDQAAAAAAAQNKEFDPLGPLPHGWGKKNFKYQLINLLLPSQFSEMCVLMIYS